jgi:uncharacterized protein YkwD
MRTAGGALAMLVLGALVVALAAVAAFWAPSARSEAIAACGDDPATPDPGAEARVVQLVNGARAQAGLPALSVNRRLTQLARGRGMDMARRHYFAHRGLWWAPRGIAAGETLAFVSTEQMALDMWLSSPTHRGTMLSAAYRLTGVGAVRACGGMLLVAQEFMQGGRRAQIALAK